MRILLVLCIFSAAQCFPTPEPYWMSQGEPNALDRWFGLRAGASRAGKLTAMGEYVPDNGGHRIAGSLGHESEYGLNVGSSILGSDLDAGVGLMKHAQVGGYAGDTYDDKGRKFHAGAGGSVGGTLFGTAGHRRGESGQAAEGRITGGLMGKVGTELRRKYNGGVEGKAEISTGGKLGTSFDFRPFGR
ncbi:uncharacterized protein [Anabrus simplex]|uniref:uncharacterized protein n=1 Tax=Anabrus simplex TaxID=316456 RepID=UPI0034DD5003